MAPSPGLNQRSTREGQTRSRGGATVLPFPAIQSPIPRHPNFGQVPDICYLEYFNRRYVLCPMTSQENQLAMNERDHKRRALVALAGSSSGYTEATLLASG